MTSVASHQVASNRIGLKAINGQLIVNMYCFFLNDVAVVTIVISNYVCYRFARTHIYIYYCKLAIYVETYMYTYIQKMYTCMYVIYV